MFKRRIPQTFFEKLRQFLWPREGWIRATKYLWQRTVRLSGTPHNLALGLAIGGFVSANPILGTHIIWGAVIIYFIGGNFIASVAGTWVGNPVTFPFIWLSTYNIGSFMLGRNGEARELPELSFTLFVEAPFSSLAPVVVPMLFGWIPVGLVIGLLVYYPSYWSIDLYQKQRSARLQRKREAAGSNDANKA